MCGEGKQMHRAKKIKGWEKQAEVASSKQAVENQRRQRLKTRSGRKAQGQLQGAWVCTDTTSLSGRQTDSILQVPPLLKRKPKPNARRPKRQPRSWRGGLSPLKTGNAKTAQRNPVALIRLASMDLPRSLSPLRNRYRQCFGRFSLWPQLRQDRPSPWTPLQGRLHPIRTQKRERRKGPALPAKIEQIRKGRRSTDNFFSTKPILPYNSTREDVRSSARMKKTKIEKRLGGPERCFLRQENTRNKKHSCYCLFLRIQRPILRYPYA